MFADDCTASGRMMRQDLYNSHSIINNHIEKIAT